MVEERHWPPCSCLPFFTMQPQPKRDIAEPWSLKVLVNLVHTFTTVPSVLNKMPLPRVDTLGGLLHATPIGN